MNRISNISLVLHFWFPKKALESLRPFASQLFNLEVPFHPVCHVYITVHALTKIVCLLLLCWLHQYQQRLYFLVLFAFFRCEFWMHKAFLRRLYFFFFFCLVSCWAGRIDRLVGVDVSKDQHCEREGGWRLDGWDCFCELAILSKTDVESPSRRLKHVRLHVDILAQVKNRQKVNTTGHVCIYAICRAWNLS